MPADQPSPETVLLLVDFKIPSENQLRYRHWSKAREFAEAAKIAWQLSLVSSPSAAASLMTITSDLREQRPFETALPGRSELTTETPGSSGNTE